MRVTYPTYTIFLYMITIIPVHSVNRTFSICNFLNSSITSSPLRLNFNIILSTVTNHSFSVCFSSKLKDSLIREQNNRQIIVSYSMIFGGNARAPLAEALRFKSQGREFDSRWCNWNVIDLILLAALWPCGRISI